jgi:hypothetical protein
MLARIIFHFEIKDNLRESIKKSIPRNDINSSVSDKKSLTVYLEYIYLKLFHFINIFVDKTYLFKKAIFAK